MGGVAGPDYIQELHGKIINVDVRDVDNNVKVYRIEVKSAYQAGLVGKDVKTDRVIFIPMWQVCVIDIPEDE
jgi:hypothetical protein